MPSVSMAGTLTTKTPLLRNHIAMDNELELKYWTKHLGVAREVLQRAVDKVGNSAAAVRKELGKAGDGQGLN
jgi:hypothetical protein